MSSSFATTSQPFPMKSLLAQTLLASALLALLASPAFAQTKIGTIDLRKVFDDYYKTKAADSTLKDLAADLEKERKAYMEQYKKITEDYKKALDDANNQAISAEEREKRKKAAEGKLLEIKELETTVTQFDNTSRSSLEEKQKQARDKILVEIRNVINTQAKTAGYSLVIDSAAETINRTPVVLFTVGDSDITTNVLTQLNATAPPGLLNGKRDEKK